MTDTKTTETATVAGVIAAETVSHVYVATDAGVEYALNYYNLPASYGVGDAVELTVETFSQTGAVVAVYVAAEKA